MLTRWIPLHVAVVLAAGCLLGVLAGAQEAERAENRSSGSWPQWRGPARNGIAPAAGLRWNWEQSPPRLLWQSEGLGQGYSSVAVVDGRIYTSGNFEDGQALVAMDAETGAVLWRTPLTKKPPQHGYKGARTTPAIDGDRLYGVMSDGQIVCLRTVDGSLVWQRDFDDWGGRMMSGWGFSESPLVDGDWVLCTPGGEEAMLVALNKLTGEEVWRSAVPEFAGDQASNGKARKRGAGYSSIVVSHGAGVKQYVQLTGGGLIGVRAEDGKFLWGYGPIANTTANIPTPLVDGDHIFCSTGYGTGAARLRLVPDGDGVRAEEEYFLQARTFENHHGGMVLQDGYVYAGHKHGNGIPICLEADSGEIVWGGDKRGVGRGSAAIVAADGHLIFRYESGEVAAIEMTPDEYRLKGYFMPVYQEDRSWAHPVVAGGRLFLREQDKLLVYDLTDST